MLAPILPSPIMPSCIESSSARNFWLSQGLFDRFREFCEIAFHVFAEVNAQRAAIAIGEHGEVTARLGGFDNAKGEFLPGNGNVGGVIASELEKDAGVRAALVSLAGGMEKTRTEAEAGGGIVGAAYL